MTFQGWDFLTINPTNCWEGLDPGKHPLGPIIQCKQKSIHVWYIYLKLFHFWREMLVNLAVQWMLWVIYEGQPKNISFQRGFSETHCDIRASIKIQGLDLLVCAKQY